MKRKNRCLNIFGTMGATVICLELGNIAASTRPLWLCVRWSEANARSLAEVFSNLWVFLKIPSVYRGLHCIGISQNHLETWRSWSDLVAFEPKELASHCHHLPEAHRVFGVASTHLAINDLSSLGDLFLSAFAVRLPFSAGSGSPGNMVNWYKLQWSHETIVNSDKTYLRNIKQYPNISKNVFASKQPSFVFLRPPIHASQLQPVAFCFSGPKRSPAFSPQDVAGISPRHSESPESSQKQIKTKFRITSGHQWSPVVTRITRTPQHPQPQSTRPVGSTWILHDIAPFACDELMRSYEWNTYLSTIWPQFDAIDQRSHSNHSALLSGSGKGIDVALALALQILCWLDHAVVKKWRLSCLKLSMTAMMIYSDLDDDDDDVMLMMIVINYYWYCCH